MQNKNIDKIAGIFRYRIKGDLSESETEKNNIIEKERKRH